MDTSTLNDQMVLMRKDFKRAKIHVISKLVRQAKQLRSKKGSDVQKQKNCNRAERLIEEVDIIKDLKPDGIFKYLLSLEDSPKPIESMHTESLQERAFCRIGNISFIKQKMEQIRQQAAAFDFVRSNKESVTSIRVSSMLSKLSPEEGEMLPQVLEQPTTTPQVVCPDVSQNITTDQPTAESPSPVHHPHLIEKNESLLETSKESSNPMDTNEKINPSTEDSVQPAKETLNSDEIINLSTTDEIGNSSHESELDESENFGVNPGDETSSIDRPVDIGNITHTDNITEVLENLGKGYSDSENDFREDSDDDCGIVSDASSDDQEESFFADSFDTKPLRQADNKKAGKPPAIAKSRHGKSTFVSSLASQKSSRAFHGDLETDLNKPRKKKNRLGQRARQKLYGSTNDIKPRKKDLHRKKPSVTKGADEKRSIDKRRGKGGSRKEEFTEKRECDAEKETLHPSWQASQAKKRQLQIHNFQGKRIKFDDSD